MGLKNKQQQTSNIFKIAIYVRVSTEEQAENPEGSIKNQELRLRDYIQLKNQIEPFGEVVSVYSDPGVSVKNKEINLVLVTELSRFSRSTKDFALLQEFLEQNSCKFVSFRENFDTSGAAGAMVLSLMASIAEFEWRQTGERISHSCLARAKRGLYNGGSLALGYESVPDKPGCLRIVESEAELVRLIFSTFLKEKTLAAAAKYLNQAEVRLPKKVRHCGAVRGNSIRFDTVYRILKNKSYVGIKVYSTKTGQSEVKAVWPAIIDETLFYRVQDLLTANCYKPRTHKNKYPFTLSGLIQCGHCGENMSGASATGGTGKRVGYYEHVATRKTEAALHSKLLDHKPRRIPALAIQDLVWAEVKKFILDKSFSDELLKLAQKNYAQSLVFSEYDKLLKKRDHTEKQIRVFAERIANLPIDVNPQPLYQKLSELQQSLQKLVLAISLEKEKSTKSDSPLELADLERFQQKLKDHIATAESDHNLRSAIMKIVVHKIMIKSAGLEIYFNVGDNHYKEALGLSPGASFFICTDYKSKKPSVDFSAQGLKLFSSSSLRNGGQRRN